MRTWDVVGLALGALWQRKVRTALTMLGVAVGSFVLVASLSIGQGVQSVLVEQLRKQDQLRRVFVWRGLGTPREEIPSAALDLKGEMSEARRQRLREAIIRRWNRVARKTELGISRERMAELAGLEHVESVTPGLNWLGRARLDGKPKPSLIYTASAGISALPGGCWRGSSWPRVRARGCWSASPWSTSGASRMKRMWKKSWVGRFAWK